MLIGLLDRWFDGSKVCWFDGCVESSIDRWFDGSLVRWIVGSMDAWKVRWIVGSMDRWIDGSLVRWIVGSMDGWSMVRWFDGLLVRWIVGSMVRPDPVAESSRVSGEFDIFDQSNYILESEEFNPPRESLDQSTIYDPHPQVGLLLFFFSPSDRNLTLPTLYCSLVRLNHGNACYAGYIAVPNVVVNRKRIILSLICMTSIMRCPGNSGS